MAIKTHKVTLSLDNPRVIQSGINVQSFDKQSIQISIELTKNDEVFQVPSDATIRVSLLKLARQEQKIIVDVPNTNRDSIDWVVPDYLDGYQGTVRVGVYLVSGAENVDLGYFTILSNVSDIDKMADEFTDNVFQGWEQIEADLNELNLTIAQTKLDLADDLAQVDSTIANINTLASDFTTDVAAKQTDVTSKYNAFDTSVTTANQTIDDILALQPQFQSVLDETTGKDVISAPEIILARGGATTLGERLDSEKAEVSAQLAQTDNEVRITQNNPTNFNGAVVTIIDDDARPDFRTVWQPILDDNPDTKISIAVVKDWTEDGSALSLSELHTLQDSGHDILCHTTHHEASYLITPENAELDYPEAVQWMKDNGLKGYEHLVYPGGLNPSFISIKDVARKHFKYAISTEAAGDYAVTPVDNWCVPRMNGDSATLAELQVAVDYAKANNIWLILMTHSHVLLSSGSQKMADFITYVKSQNVPILPYSEAVKLKGNAIALGEHTSENSMFVDVSGKAKGNPTLSSGTWTPRLEGSTGQGVHTYTKQLGAWTKIENMVFLTYDISILAAGIDASMSGNLKVTGLPFTSASIIRNPVNYNVFNLGTNFTTVFAISGFPASSFILVKNGTNVNEAFLESSAVVPGQSLNLSGLLCYKIP